MSCTRDSNIVAVIAVSAVSSLVIIVLISIIITQCVLILRLRKLKKNDKSYYARPSLPGDIRMTANEAYTQRNVHSTEEAIILHVKNNETQSTGTIIQCYAMHQILHTEI